VKKTLLDDKNRSDEPEMPFFRVNGYKKPSRPLRLSPTPQKGYAIIDMSGLMG
jgi:hypothetical protein